MVLTMCCFIAGFRRLVETGKASRRPGAAGGIYYQSSDQPVLQNVALDGQLSAELKVVSPRTH